ncbi:TlpA disulfide reductase family protein [Sporosarcina sp. FSL K6-2383]|uniref:peroxiredoxin family protein n=1 Tax=Sporosarcina sp. FSL K6-2383 TaxID=2921556 RepID=UPI00315A9316
MNKKIIGYIITVLLIGSMVVLMIKSNLEKTEPIENYLAGSEELPGLKKGTTPPDFELTTLSGDVVKLSDLKGKKVVLNFWASWCGPCKVEMPHMQNYYKKNKDKENVEFIAVNLTTGEKRGIEGVEQFVEAYGLTFPIPMDIDGTVGKQYEVMTIPTTYMIGTDGVIAFKKVGPMDEKMLKALIDNLN